MKEKKIKGETKIKNDIKIMKETKINKETQFFANFTKTEMLPKLKCHQN